MKTVVGYENQPRVTVDRRAILGSDEIGVIPQIKAVLDVLLIERPLWEFRVSNLDFNSRASCVEAYMNGEALGHITWTWHGSTNKYRVHNDRINNSRVNRSSYFTKDMGRAVLAAKKEFYTETPAERMNKAKDRADNHLKTASRLKWQEMTDNQRAVQKAAMAWIDGPGLQAFLAYVQANDAMVHNTYMKGLKIQTEQGHVAAIVDAHDKGKTLIVQRNSVGYIVKAPETPVETHTDATLSADARLKLGMLKLVENQQFISGVGFRVDEDLFVLLPEESKNEGQ